MNIKETFSNIYENNSWKSGSGPGSSPKITTEYRDFLTIVIQKYKIKTVLDYGCGDWKFSHLIPWNNLVDTYTGVDVVDTVIEKNKLSFETDKIKFLSINDCWKWPCADLIICKDVFQHLSNPIVTELLHQMIHHSSYMLITNDIYVDNEIVNSDCVIGKSRPLDLTLNPWEFMSVEKFTWQKTKNRIKETILIKNEKK